jgi:hypothetical protein
LREQQSKQVDELERHIDADLDENWRGGSFRFSRYRGRLSDGIVKELQRRYGGWTVRQEIDGDGDGALVFTPLLRAHRVARSG